MDKELAKDDDATRIPVDTVTETLNKITKGKPRIVVLPKEARFEAMQIAKQKMVFFKPDTAEALSQIPKNWEAWWEYDPENPAALRSAMLARSFIASVWASEKYGSDVLPIARPVPMSKNQVRHLIQTIHLLHKTKV